MHLYLGRWRMCAQTRRRNSPRARHTAGGMGRQTSRFRERGRKVRGFRGNVRMYIVYETARDAGPAGHDPVADRGWEEFFDRTLAILYSGTGVVHLEPSGERAVAARPASVPVSRPDGGNAAVDGEAAPEMRAEARETRVRSERARALTDPAASVRLAS